VRCSAGVGPAGTSAPVAGRDSIAGDTPASRIPAGSTPSLPRRTLLGSALALWAQPANATTPARAFEPLRFPRDHGAHPEQRIEWWYLTGWADERTGVQITLFRARLGRRRDAAFGSDQILIGHVAVVREDWPSVIHAQTAWRSLEGLTVCATHDMHLQCPGWSMQREPDDTYLMRVEQGRLKLRLRAHAPDAPVLQGLAGHSRKGPNPDQFSRYYSRTQMRLDARIQISEQALPLSAEGRSGVAWFDHEWSDQLLDAAAAGWDWFGLNFDDGSAWMAFRIRDRSGATLWTSEPDLRFEVSENWTSPLSGARYPIGLRIHSRRGTLLLKPLIAAQEIDARASTGNRYWEGAVRAYDHQGQQIGRGYLELTGYDRPMRL